MSFTTRALISATLAAAMNACGSSRDASPVQPEVSDADVHHFVAALKQLSPSDSACNAFSVYLGQATRGLDAYRRKFDVDQRALCVAVRKSPQRYAALDAKLPALDSAASMVGVVFNRFAALHPLANSPGVYFIVGNGIAGGNTIGGRHPIVLVAMELNRSVDGLARVVAHELTHTQQDFPLIGAMNGGPEFWRGSLLRHSIMEGSADLVAELLTGQPIRNEYGEAHEAELWNEFQRDAHSKNYSRWLYNGWNRKALGERPPDLGYWLGYRISKSYYDHARDKRHALDEILAIRDFDQFLADSKYVGR
ncbi:MAG: DUF2268 domain-containing putative Zn-dependent protease [bacterium]